DCDFGLGIVMKGKPDIDLNLSKDELDKMTYEDVVNGKENFLNLKDENYLFEFLETI
ncbi:MAG: class I SAM-dependent methyltransferase, partial [Oscillatoriales cyanobacterium]